MRGFTHFGFAATVAALAAGGMIALGGALPASAAAVAHPAAHVTVSVMAPAGPRASAVVPDTAPGLYKIKFTVTIGSITCIEPAVLEFYFSSFGFWNIKITVGDNVCLVNGNPLQWEAAATCSGFNLWGSPAVASGDVTIASCNKSHPTFQHGGYRINVDGSWVYHTDLISPA